MFFQAVLTFFGSMVGGLIASTVFEFIRRKEQKKRDEEEAANDD